MYAHMLSQFHFPYSQNQANHKQHQNSLLTHSEETDKIYNFSAFLQEKKIEKPIGFEPQKLKPPF